ncbi:protein SSX1-like [Phacochoerus africanus]|uniref:protein SSX1-like n=1 Tax=Phacochoerus africanus TaxID=41426 RepID=UPI001FD9D39C|nr:protein SSX1-like [Phacochoerus africanus]
MNRGSYFAQRTREDAQKSEKKSKAFNDISKYFSKEEWAKLGYSEKITYVCMKRNYDTMTGLGSGRSKINVWTHRLRERKYPVIYEEISDPEEDD